jgi:hypothetical protein
VRRVYLYLVLAVSTVMAAGFPVAVFNGSSSANLAGALAGLAAFLFLGYARDSIVGMKNQNQLKMLINTVESIVEILVIGGLMLSPAVPKLLAIGVLTSVMFVKVFQREVAEYLNTEAKLKFGMDYRIYISLLAAALALLNTYYTFLGGLLLLGITLYDGLSLKYRLYLNRDNIKLKNRILSH